VRALCAGGTIIGDEHGKAEKGPVHGGDRRSMSERAIPRASAIMLGLTQQQLAEMIGVTYQQGA